MAAGRDQDQVVCLRPLAVDKMSGPREAIFPTRMALTNTKLRLKGAQTGHSLLAKKRDALTTRFRAILRKVDDVSNYIDTFALISAIYDALLVNSAKLTR